MESTSSQLISDKLKEYMEVEQPDKYSSLVAEVVRADVGGNSTRFFLQIVRKMKSYNEQSGPFDALKVVVDEDGSYKLVAYGKTIENNVIDLPISTSFILTTLDQLCDDSWIACPGIEGYSKYKQSIG